MHWSTVGRLSVDCRPIVGRLPTDSRPIVDWYIGRLSAYMSTEATYSTHNPNCLLLQSYFPWIYTHNFHLSIFALVCCIYHNNNKQLKNHIHNPCFDMLLYMINFYLVCICESFLSLLQNLHIWQKVLVAVCGNCWISICSYLFLAFLLFDFHW